MAISLSPPITVAEFREGVELADTQDRPARRMAVLTDIVSQVEVLHYTVVTATVHARLLAVVRTAGRPRGAHDLTLAAHAVETGRVLISRDAAARFGELPGVTVATPTGRRWRARVVRSCA